MKGAYIASSPNPVSWKEFMRELRRAVGVPFGLPASAWMVRVASRFLRTDPDLALYGRYVVSRRLREENFEFKFAKLSDALRDLLRPSRALRVFAKVH
jgi:NAD dependent epimerase/dehydratase family enzyme